ncbi:hypothetical protein FC40_GL001202 [Ligilactobacillus hayakitensis DSM 18933 = JCM 14209]|uniref:Uncharacterized protein n=1 Tax=Ligilactobacillus hayakitensis DSM 18933 = JCM 14209 TaxID=1423755 RepID=A0A0R1WNM9_9LACO|nr:hypothetical protein [Ligilactobacillus hayakitensis]KRM17305.1 hypothetical protein FC40_GL001202 [Ligilactobacillus hayakitensis DSM 18933 = JCM 14209]
MQISNSIYPYPVLSIDDEDYIESSKFEVSYRKSEFSENKIVLDYKLKDDGLEELFYSGKASFYLHVECSYTMYRTLIKLENQKKRYVFSIDPNVMVGNVHLTPFLLIDETLTGLTINSINTEIYGDDYVFPDLQVGDPLAVGFTATVAVNEDKSFKNIDSIIKVTRSVKETMQIDLDSDIAYVRLPEKQFEIYLGYKDLNNITNSMIIYPALIQILNYVKENQDAFEEKQWYKVIEKRCEVLEIDIDEMKRGDINPIEVAQRILEDPVARGLKTLEGVISDED